MFCTQCGVETYAGFMHGRICGICHHLQPYDGIYQVQESPLIEYRKRLVGVTPQSVQWSTKDPDNWDYRVTRQPKRPGMIRRILRWMQRSGS